MLNVSFGSTTGAYFAQYELQQGSLFIEYSSGPCRPERKGGWNVARDVVIMVNFSPKLRRRIADLKLDSKKFRKVIDDHVIGALYYVNDEEGVTYAVQSESSILSSTTLQKEMSICTVATQLMKNSVR